CDRLRGQGRINRLENIAVRSVAVTEAWQESGLDYVTVHFLASLLDYTVDERSGQVVDGSRTEPVKFEEDWTFMRPVGPNALRRGAIKQAKRSRAVRNRSPGRSEWPGLHYSTSRRVPSWPTRRSRSAASPSPPRRACRPTSVRSWTATPPRRA